ncbi:MAG: hypothetical protein IPM97_01295 [Bdellovibrionaceae bacterium]|nr:hypothetical protein [Pseudobdellovibrionaceae bacterium]
MRFILSILFAVSIVYPMLSLAFIPRACGPAEMMPAYPEDQQPMEACSVYKMTGYSDDKGMPKFSRQSYGNCADCSKSPGTCVNGCFVQGSRCMAKGTELVFGETKTSYFTAFGASMDDSISNAIQYCKISGRRNKNCSVSCCTEQAFNMSSWSKCNQ